MKFDTSHAAILENHSNFKIEFQFSLNILQVWSGGDNLILEFQQSLAVRRLKQNFTILQIVKETVKRSCLKPSWTSSHNFSLLQITFSDTRKELKLNMTREIPLMPDDRGIQRECKVTQ